MFKNAIVINPEHPRASSVVEVVDTTEEWCQVKQKRSESGSSRRGSTAAEMMWICPKHEISPMRMVQLRDR